MASHTLESPFAANTDFQWNQQAGVWFHSCPGKSILGVVMLERGAKEAEKGNIKDNIDEWFENGHIIRTLSEAKPTL
ncbi:hypothetical protein PAAG_07141 [Paracoccidioides lutzii Pb01]|uniref:Uncharacterized protein n=1 Tax=Paracoccidioides lutzii (strain ATCC MYA-826 / Pb01) TaxID=502779 RepID=C1H8Q0_PARBA|nr:hypothetical protein PAAG_07141 [Paracoccidioides lutzii Pb01]EEH36723.2 hypothetical protein PAAG_07141 [Paracoccidioides lutzii Pb01]